MSGLPGDLVTEQDRAFFVNGAPVATGQAQRAASASRWRSARPAAFRRGCYFVATEHKDGFDSRYAAIGWICAPRILGVGRPIL